MAALLLECRGRVRERACLRGIQQNLFLMVTFVILVFFSNHLGPMAEIVYDECMKI